MTTTADRLRDECACEETHADHEDVCEQARGDNSQLGYCDPCWRAHDLEA